MSRTKRYQIKHKQEVKRKKERQKLIAQGKNPNEYFYNGFCVKPKG